MRKRIFSILTIALAIMTASCQKENVIAGELGTDTGFAPMTINAVVETAGVKSGLTFIYNLLWEAEDTIYVSDADGKSDNFSLTGGAGTKEGIFVQEGETAFSGTVEAFYPTTLIENNTLIWPGVQKPDQKIPLFSTKALTGSDNEKFRFSCLGAILQIVFNATSDDIILTSVEIRDEKKAMSGVFSVEDGQAVITAKDKAGIILNLGEGVSLGKGANYFNFVVPAGKYDDLTFIFNAANGKKCVMTGGQVELSRNDVAKITLTGNNFRYYSLPGEFSVGEGKKVQFTRGNLYWNGSAFKMENNQYDYLEEFAHNHVSYFQWNKDAQKSISEFDTKGRLFTNTEETTPNPELKVGFETGVYRVLSAYEWQYLLGIDRDYNIRENAASLRKWGVTVCGVKNCFIIAPDVCLNGYVFDKNKTSYDTAEWAIAEQAGLVCLPPAGQYKVLGKKGDYYEGVDYAGESCYYWSSTYQNSTLYPLSLELTLEYTLTVSGVSLGDGISILGCSIRLVKDVQQ